MKRLLPILSLSLTILISLAGRANGFDPKYLSWQAFLDRFVKEGLVDYGAVKKAPNLLDKAIRNLEKASEKEYRPWDREEKMAFWINAYNVAAVKVVTEHYPIERSFSWKAVVFPKNSIQQINDVWERGIIRIMGKQHSLDGIQKGILLKQFQEPRVHFAIVCASIGCPVLREEPYLGEKLGRQLADQTRRFLSDPAKARYEAAEEKLLLSPIFKWYREEFRQEAGSLVRYVKENAPTGAMQTIDEDRLKVEYLEYDWSLNDLK
jgi:hypothetical protein